MSTLIVPVLDEEPWPTLGGQVCEFLEARSIYGPGSLKGEPYVITPEFRAVIYRLYEVFPRGHELEGLRRFDRAAISERKGKAKCLGIGTPVLMGDGSQLPAEQIRVGDQVLAYAGGQLAPAAVSHVEIQEPSPLLRITTRFGRSLVVTEEHPMLVRGTRMLPGVPARRRYPSCDPDRDTEQWVTAGELLRGDRLVVGLDWSPRGSVPDSDTELGWQLGAFVGDGSPDGRFTSADPEIIERWRSSFTVTDLGRYDFYIRGIRPLLRRHGLLGCNARTKRVPAAIFTAGREVVAAFLAGYLDTDGWATYTPQPTRKTSIEIAWGSVNRELLVECQTLLASVGVNAAVAPSNGTYLGEPHEAWKLVVRDSGQAASLARLLMPHAAHPKKRTALESIRDHRSAAPFGSTSTDKVVAVENLGHGPSIAIEVEGLHTHVTGGLVTHNTEKAAQVAYAELHPEGPVRFDGWDSSGNPVGRPVADPYIPLLAYTKDQSDELAYNVLLTLCLEGPDADLFDAGLERIIRLGPRGLADGKAIGLASSPNANDGARTTFQVFDETHRMTLPRLKQAVETMLANTPKRQAEDPWTLMATTAGALGESSVAEDVHDEAKKISEGRITAPKLFYFHREASPGHNLETVEGRVAAVREATGPDGEFGRGQFLRIAQQWDREGADLQYLERVWLNRWVASSATAFDVAAWNLDERAGPKLRRKSLVVAGFDGARFQDATGIVLTDIETGQQQRWALWERPEDVDEWEVDEDEVTESVAQMMREFQVWRMYCDPPYWTATIGSWQQQWPDQVKEFWTARKTQMAWAVRAYAEAIKSGAVTHDGDPDFARHIANAGRRDIEMYDDEGKKLFLLRKQKPELKFDLAMAGCISWRAFLDARAKGVRRRKRRAPRQIR